MVRDNIGQLIKTARNQAKLTQEELAELLGEDINGFNISMWETGKTQPRTDLLIKLSRALNKQLNYFIS